MKDVFGNEIQLGDRVATNCYGYTDSLRVAHVIGFTAKKVRVEFEQGGEQTKFPRQLARENA